MRSQVLCLSWRVLALTPRDVPNRQDPLAPVLLGRTHHLLSLPSAPDPSSFFSPSAYRLLADLVTDIHLGWASWEKRWAGNRVVDELAEA
jgi:hypothetical protein